MEIDYICEVDARASGLAARTCITWDLAVRTCITGGLTEHAKGLITTYAVSFLIVFLNSRQQQLM